MDRDELLATMYRDDEPDIQPAPSIDQRQMRSRKIRVGIIEYEVPTVEYVQHLEQIIAQQAQMLAQHRRVIARMESAAHGARNFLRHQADNIVDIRHELARKVDQVRDYDH